MQRSASTRAALVTATFVVLVSAATPAYAGQTTRVSVDNSGNEYTLWSTDNSISSSGNKIAFQKSVSTDGYTNGIFVRNRNNNTTIRIDVDLYGNPGNGDSSEPRISANGDFVAFTSTSSDLVSGDNNGLADVFIRDLAGQQTELVSVATGGGSGSDGGWKPSISSGGRYVAFQSSGTDLASNATSDLYEDIFVRDTVNDTTVQESVLSNGTRPGCVWNWYCGAQEPEISGNGDYVVFHSGAEFTSGDTGQSNQVYRVTLSGNTMSRVTTRHPSADPQDAVGGSEAQISNDGSVVAYNSSAWGMVLGDNIDIYDAFVYDFGTGDTTRVSAPGSDSSYSPSLSPDGSMVGFMSYSSDIVSNDTNGSVDGFVYDRDQDQVRRVTTDSNGSEADWDSWFVNFADNDTIAFASLASNLIGSNDTNGEYDVFVKEI